MLLSEQSLAKTVDVWEAYSNYWGSTASVSCIKLGFEGFECLKMSEMKGEALSEIASKQLSIVDL
jgi:hypothetical protein